MSVYTKIINGIKFNLKTEEVLYFQSESLFKAISKISPGKICDNYRIEVGFSIFILRKKQGKQEYDILVPDYNGTPFSENTDDLTLAFLIQLEQIKLLKKYNISGVGIRFDDEIVVAKKTLDKQLIRLQRFTGVDGSGWYINEIYIDKDGSYENVDAKEFEVIYAYQLLSIRPSILSVLFLPYEYMVIFSDDECLAILDDNDNILVDRNADVSEE